jgi:NADH:ubiquinone oxidoreductase subunit K
MFLLSWKLENIFTVLGVGGYLTAIGLVWLVNPDSRQYFHLVNLLLAFELTMLGIASLILSVGGVWGGSISFVQTVALVLLALAGVESALGLALVLIISRAYSSIRINELHSLKG